MKQSLCWIGRHRSWRYLDPFCKITDNMTRATPCIQYWWCEEGSPLNSVWEPFLRVKLFPSVDELRSQSNFRSFFWNLTKKKVKFASFQICLKSTWKTAKKQNLEFATTWCLLYLLAFCGWRLKEWLRPRNGTSRCLLYQSSPIRKFGLLIG